MSVSSDKKRERAGQQWFGRGLADYLGLGLVLVVLIVFFGFQTRHFFSQTTFLTIANQIPDALIIAVGMTIVLILGGIDLSVGSVLALSSTVLAMFLMKGMPLAIAIPSAVGCGLICGILNGLLVVQWRLPSFIVTLGMLEVARGCAYLMTGSQTLYVGTALNPLVSWKIFGLSLPFFIALLVVVIGQTLLSFTTFGRHLFAVGANEETARLSGIGTQKITVAVFAISGFLAAMASIIHCARLSAADPNSGAGYELQAIAAVVIGGTSLMGGRGSIISTFFGVIIIAVLENGLVQIGAQDPIKRLVTGCVIVIAVIIDFYRHRLGQKKA